MALKVKEKMVDGKILKGIINSNLAEVAPFIFRNIYVYKGNSYNETIYYICETEDGTCSLYNGTGECLLDYSEGYKKLRILKYSIGNYSIEVAAEKDGKKGILKRKYLKETDSSKLEEVYPFGKCDEIEELNDGTVRLRKHTKSGDRIGFWYHKRINEKIDPKYLTYDYTTISPANGVGIYQMRDEYGNRSKMRYRTSDYIEKDALTRNVEMIIYSKLKNKKPVFGVKQKVVTRASDYIFECNFEDCLPAEYSNIKYDSERQIFFLEKIVEGKRKKGFIGVTFDWHFTSVGWRLYGYPNLRKKVDIPCNYDEINIIDDNYALLKKENKYGLLGFSFGKSNGDYDLFNRKNFSDGYSHEIVPCLYDSIKKAGQNFIGHIGNEEQIITNIIVKGSNENEIIKGNYKKIVQLTEDIFLCELEDGKKELIFLKYYTEYYSNYKSYVLTKIAPCDNAEIILNEYRNGYLLKVVNDNVIDVYYENRKTHNIEKLEKNVFDVSYNSESKSFIINKKNGHIVYTNPDGQTLFSTKKLGLEPKNISIEYLSALKMYKVTNNGLIKLGARIDIRTQNFGHLIKNIVK